MTGTPTPPPTVTKEYGFDVLVSKGTSLIAEADPNPDTGDGDDNNDASDEDEELLPPYAPSWESVKLDIMGGEPELHGFTFSMRYWERTTSESVDTDGNETTSYSLAYPAWTLTSQTIEIVPPDKKVFFTDNGDELYPTSPLPKSGSVIGSGGIKNGSKYSYLLVFDEAELEWLPRCSTLRQPSITKKTPPTDMVPILDLPFPKLPMDTLSSLVPDERPVVTLQYKVTSQYTSIFGSGEHTFIIEHPCTQDQEITAEKMEAILDKCYFTHGFHHIQMYDVDAPPNYDEYGDPIPLVDEQGNPILDENGNPTFNVIEPIYLKNEADSELVGFPVYELQNSVWVLNEIDKIPEQEAASEISLQETVDEGQEQIKGLEDLMATTQQEYENEIASIDKIQQENADIIRVNEERKSKLLGNIKNMITGTTSDTSSTTEETEETTSTNTTNPNPITRSMGGGNTNTNTTNTNPTPRSSGSSSTGGY